MPSFQGTGRDSVFPRLVEREGTRSELERDSWSSCHDITMPPTPGAMQRCLLRRRIPPVSAQSGVWGEGFRPIGTNRAGKAALRGRDGHRGAEPLPAL